MTFDGLLDKFGRRIAAHSIHGLGRGLDWLTAHHPAEATRPAICHGDFHPQNILMENGVVTGVIDWPNALVADPAYDVATTRIILGLVPLELSTLPAVARVLLNAARPLLLARYLAGYRRGQPIGGPPRRVVLRRSTLRALRPDHRHRSRVARHRLSWRISEA